MLDPEYLRGLPDPIVDLYAEAERDIIADMARRIKNAKIWTSSVDYQNWMLREAGVVQRDILRALSERTKLTEERLAELMREAAERTVETDLGVFRAAGHTAPTMKDSQTLTDVLRAGYRATSGEMRNLTRTTAVNGAYQFRDVLDGAWRKVTSGAFDQESAIRSAIKELAGKGLDSIYYPASGRRDSLEVAVRRAVQTGINQTAGKLQEELADELDCDLVEVTAHAGARPSHAEWQGKIYSRSGKDPKYPDFRSSTGYGKVDGLCGVNCRHSFGPYIEGSPRVRTEEKLAELEEPKYEYNGKLLTEYEASQMQRRNEREIRRWKREEAMLDAIGEDSSEAASKVAAWQRRQADFLEQTGLKRQYEREDISVTQRVTGVVNSRQSIEENKYGKHKHEKKPKQSDIKTDVHFVTTIDVSKYKCISESITTDEVIITDERIKHIQYRHPNDFERYKRYIAEIVANPDYILEANKPNTAFILKEFVEDDERFELILRLAVQGDPEEYKNSVITFLKVKEKRYQRYLRTKNILYKSENL